jgi:hypothetical protein
MRNKKNKQGVDKTDWATMYLEALSVIFMKI